MSKITRYELSELEAKPKTKIQIVLDYIISFLPIIVGLLTLLEYYLIPNIRVNEKPHPYGIFIGFKF